MKKRKAMIMAAIGFLATGILGYLQNGRDMSVCSSHWNTFDNGSTMDITVIANKLYIHDEEKFAEQILQKCVDNSFYGVRFSYDMNGYPNELSVSVYMDPMARELKKRAFQIRYTQDLEYQYGIRDGIDKFRVEFIYD